MSVSYTNLMESTIYFIFFLLLIHYGSATLGISIALTIVIFILWLSKKNRHNIIDGKWVTFYILLLALLFIIQINRNSLDNSNSDFKFVFLNYGYIPLLLMIFPMYEILCKDKVKFLHNIFKLGILILIIKTLSWGVYNFFNINLGFTDLGGGVGWHRAVLGKLYDRMNGTFLDGYLLAYAGMQLMSNKNKKINYFIVLLFIILYSVVVYQSRAQFVFYIFSLLIGILYCSIKHKNRLISILIFILFLCAISFLFREKIFNFISSFSIYSENGGSTLIRLQEYFYFPYLWKSTNIYWGFGIYNEANPLISNGIRLYISDIGIIMQLYQFGIIGFLISIIPLIFGFVRAIKDLLTKNNEFNILLVLITAYLLISSTNFNMYYSALFPIIPFYISLILFNNYLDYVK